MFDVDDFRSLFPILSSPVRQRVKLVYVDNAATSQKPMCVIEMISDFYKSYNSNINYGMYDFSILATEAYNSARLKIAKYCGVAGGEIVFTYGTTDGMNMLASSYGGCFLKKNDKVLIGAAEHHSSYLPWKILCQNIGAKIEIIPLVGARHELDVGAYESMFDANTKLVVVQHISNVLGNVNDVRLLSDIAHRNGAIIAVDGAASLIHGSVDLRDMDCDFFVTSSHKAFGPSGVGFLFGRRNLLEAMAPYRVGGRMVDEVTFDGERYKSPPERFEAGTPNISAVIGFGNSIDFLSRIDWNSARQHLNDLSDHCRNRLSEIDELVTYGSGNAGIFSFNVSNIHCHDVATILASHGIAIRAGHHCAQPLMNLLKVSGTARISLCLYNTKEEIDFIADTLKTCKSYFTR
jgi:cysteine desulfurase/selenocysteine lyase